MGRFKRLLGYLAEWKGYFSLTVIFNLIGVIFTLIGISSIMPLVELLFKGESADAINEFLKPNPNIGFSREFLEYEVNHWFAKSISEATTFIEGKKIALFNVCMFIAGSFFLKNFFLYLANFFLAPVRNGIIASLRNDVYSKMLRLPLSYYSDERKGDLISKMSNDVMQVESGMIAFQRLLREPIQILIFLFGLLFISWELTLVVLLLLPLTALFVSVLGKGLKRTSKKAQSQLGQVLSVVEETLSAVKVIKGFAVENTFMKSFRGFNQRFFVLRNRQIRKSTASSPISETIGILVFAIVMWVGGNIVFEDGGIRGATLITFLMYMWGLLSPIKALIGAINNLQVSMVSMDRLDEILEAESKNETTGGEEVTIFEDEILLKDVRFKYEDEEVIKGVSLSIPKGKTVALVGQSGSGKSTLADLVPRFHDVTDGEILLDGKNIKQLNIQSLRRLTGIVTQDSILFNDSVRNNLSLGVDGISEDQFQNALKIANAHEFVANLEAGIDTVIGEGGGKLSGGQRQRLCIARAVLQNPPLLILDEATSALDTESEKLVQDALEKVMAGRTAIVIAHRLSTIKNADIIVVMEKGQIVEQGSHDELYEQKGHYYKLCTMQQLN